MQAPAFWNQKPGLMSTVLAPLGWLYGAATARRVAHPPMYTASIPVICVGNINVGGTGKTPTTIALLERLIARGQRPCVVSRGYGGTVTQAVQVDEALHTATDVGDEPLLMAAFAPVFVGPDRVSTAQLAETSGATVIVMDDGFQDPKLAKDLSIVVVDARQGFGNGKCLPAGPLREPVDAGLKRADMLLSIGPEKAQKAFRALYSTLTVPHVTGDLIPLPTGLPWQGLRVVAFAGIGQPDKFFRTLKTLGADIIRAEALSDHQLLTDALLARLAEEAAAKNAQLVCTEKDAVRVPASYKSKILALPVRLALTDWTEVDQAFDRLGL